MKNRFFLSFSLILVMVVNGFAQLSDGGTPFAFLRNGLPGAPTMQMEPFDVQAMLKEDESLNQKEGPFRFGKNFETAITLSNSGQWTELEEGRLWQLALYSPGAYSINLTFADFFIPKGGRFFIYSADKSVVLGAFTALNNNSERVFGTDLVKGDKIILEYFEPKAVKNHGSLVISLVTHAYRDVFNWDSRNFGSSGTCNINAACPDGDDWRDQIRSVVMLVSGGNGFCSGALINNTAMDGKPYLLTANHCGSTGFGSWVFRFNWQSANCPNPSSSPTSQSLTGAQLRARNSGSDFLLLELNNQVPANYNAYFSGWYNENIAPTSSVGIHHPSGDIKKISISNFAATSQNWGSAQTWRVPRWSKGTTEGGSSGSPLYNSNGLIVGQLYGGSAACGNNLEDYYGKLSTSWSGTSSTTRLSDWLDPSNTGVTSLQGYDPNVSNFADDAGVVSVSITPLSNPTNIKFCRDSINPVVTIRNYGTNNLTSVKINYQLNAGIMNTITWSGNLAPGAIEQVILNPILISSGNNTLSVSTANPNGLSTDPNPLNDSKSISFVNEFPANVLAITPPFIEGFEATTFPPSGWTRENPDNSTTWQRTGSVGGFTSQGASAFINNFSYSAIGERDNLLTPYFNMSTAISPVRLEFDVAYARYDATLHDSLIVSVSSDCGGVWSRVYAKGSWGLSTVGNTNRTTAFTPTPEEWRKEVLDLDAFIGQPHIRIRFENRTGNGNRLYLDNVSLFDKTVGVEEHALRSSFKAYPNPANDFITVELPVSSSRVSVLDMLGKEVFVQSIAAGQEMLKINLENLKNGIYIIEVNTQGHNLRQKFFKIK
jgi:hypothetical protein